LPEHEATLAALRDEALPRTAEEVEHDRSSHQEAVIVRGQLQKYRVSLQSIDEFFANDPPPDQAEDWRKKRESYVEVIASLEEQLGQRQTYRFQDADKDWWHEALVQLLADLEILKEAELWQIEQPSGRYVCGVDEVLERLEFANGVDELTLTGEVARVRWDEAVRSIADQAECPQYVGLEISPQRGLFPIGRDPRTGLWEFSHLQSGEEAQRNPESGELKLRADTGLVFVLIPGGTFLMGAQADDPAGPNYDPLTIPEEGPVHEVTLEAFFISKYEMTQTQYSRGAHHNPSLYRGGSAAVFDPETGELIDEITTLNPVESVTWEECMYLSRTFDLDLPSEAQWEYAARANTSTPWWTGADGASLEGAENVGDQATTIVGSPAWTYEAWNDGFPTHSPVHAMRANPWGLHQVLGNVGEWTAEVYVEGYPEEPVGPKGLHVEGAPTSRDKCTLRGPGWYRPREAYRVTARYGADPDRYKTEHFGLRPARAIDP
jgi:formylglycine-generating enzyme required for sulfatase activity